ncbi:DUF6307 family protein [Pseudonocardia pini]|uniref:DUF6307 family protein n=1 Tax=Pseudonocardia pini TaxID=2758030 RepID=UPI0015F0B00C|nr:DUF6307 family protein [Pseudonocardia pini]
MTTTLATDLRQTPYERRVELVTEVVTANSTIKESAAVALAVQILSALDHIPERVR